jgi:helicase
MYETQRHLKTGRGVIRYPAYVPVTTFGKKYPLDALIQPYLPRLSQAVMVSYHYARQMKQRPRLPLLIDSGGFAALFEGTRIVEEGTLGVLEIPTNDGVERLHPADVLDFQEQNADVAFTLDFPIPPKTDPIEADHRQRFTISNAIWAVRNRRRQGLPLFACIQAWDESSAANCAAQLAAYPFDGFAIGGLVPRVRDFDLVVSIIAAVQSEIGDRPLHVFGLGKPETTSRLFDIGVDSVDSSSYVKLAVGGKSWSDPKVEIENPSTTDLLQLALLNLAVATNKGLPLGAAMHFRSIIDR